MLILLINEKLINIFKHILSCIKDSETSEINILICKEFINLLIISQKENNRINYKINRNLITLLSHSYYLKYSNNILNKEFDCLLNDHIKNYIIEENIEIYFKFGEIKKFINLDENNNQLWIFDKNEESGIKNIKIISKNLSFFSVFLYEIIRNDFRLNKDYNKSSFFLDEETIEKLLYSHNIVNSTIYNKLVGNYSSLIFNQEKNNQDYNMKLISTNGRVLISSNIKLKDNPFNQEQNSENYFQIFLPKSIKCFNYQDKDIKNDLNKNELKKIKTKKIKKQKEDNFKTSEFDNNLNKNIINSKINTNNLNINNLNIDNLDELKFFIDNNSVYFENNFFSLCLNKCKDKDISHFINLIQFNDFDEKINLKLKTLMQLNKFCKNIKQNSVDSGEIKMIFDKKCLEVIYHIKSIEVNKFIYLEECFDSSIVLNTGYDILIIVATIVSSLYNDDEKNISVLYKKDITYAKIKLEEFDTDIFFALTNE